MEIEADDRSKVEVMDWRRALLKGVSRLVASVTRRFYAIFRESISKKDLEEVLDESSSFFIFRVVSNFRNLTVTSLSMGRLRWRSSLTSL